MVVPFGSHFHLLCSCFWPQFPHLFGSAELAVTSGSTLQSFCNQGYTVDIVQLFCMHVGAVHVDRLWCAYIRSYNQFPPDSESECMAAKYDRNCGSYFVTKPVLPTATIF